jgi:FkbM family methyltransferase
MSLRLVFKSIWQNPGNRGSRLRKSAAAVAWQVRKRTLRTPHVLFLANGAKFKAYPDCVVSSSLVYSDWPEFHEIQFVRRMLKPGDLVLDVGANVGHISLLVSDIAGAENIFAFEPTPISFRRLTENWKLNHWPTSNLYQIAVGRSAGTVCIPDTTSPETKNAIHSAAGAMVTVEVPLVSLDQLRTQWRGRRIGLLKIDVEGYEKEVFAGAQELLREERPRLLMFESLGGQIDESVEMVLRQSHYRIFQLDEAGRPDFDRASAQNLFAAPEEGASLLR